jgi:hypothetical protein
MSTTRRFPQAACPRIHEQGAYADGQPALPPLAPSARPLASALGLLALLAGPARADENMLRGPHPFLKDNELSAHVQLVGGIGDTPGGTKIAADYGYRLRGPAWLNLQLNYQHAACHTPSGAPTCDEASGSVFETLAGIKLKWATPIPVVPYVKGDVGLAYAFPNGAGNGMGVAARAGAGATYFFFDWFGLGAELGYSVGHLSTAKSTYAEIDFGGGLEFQF